MAAPTGRAGGLKKGRDSWCPSNVVLRRCGVDPFAARAHGLLTCPGSIPDAENPGLATGVPRHLR